MTSKETDLDDKVSRCKACGRVTWSSETEEREGLCKDCNADRVEPCEHCAKSTSAEDLLSGDGLCGPCVMDDDLQRTIDANGWD